MFRYSSPWCHLHSLHCQSKLNSQWSLSTHATWNCESRGVFTSVKKTNTDIQFMRWHRLWIWFLMARYEEKRIPNSLESDEVSVFKFRRFLSLVSRSVLFSYTNPLAFMSPRVHCIWIILNYIRSVKNQRVIHRSTQCSIDGQENNNGNLALGFEQWVELFSFKKVPIKVWFCFVMWFKCSEQQLRFVYEVWTSSIIQDPTTCAMYKAPCISKQYLQNYCKCLTRKTSQLLN